MAFFKKNGFNRDRSRSDERRNRGEFEMGGRGRDREGSFDRPRGRPSFGRDSEFSMDRPRRNPSLELFDATCDKCGKSCQLPFKPNGGKPVYCRDCFRSNDGFDSRAPSSSSSSNSNSSMELEQINRKLDKIMKALKLI